MLRSIIFFIIIFLLIAPSCTKDPQDHLEENQAPTITISIPTSKGLSTLNVNWNGLNRKVIINIPSGYDENSVYPMVFFLHGGGGTVDRFVSSHNNFISYSDRENVILVAPQGTPTVSESGYRWNAWDDNNANDDVGFLAALMEGLTHDMAIDRGRIFISGFSNGAAMSQRFAAERPGMILGAAAICHSSGFKYTEELGGVRFSLPTPVSPVSLLLIRGGSDIIIPSTKIPSGKGKIFDTPLEQTSFWVEANQCNNIFLEQETQEQSITTRRYELCANNKIVHSLYSKFLMHTWPDDHREYGIDVNQIVLDFFLSL